jgi:hypothetical protein
MPFTTSPQIDEPVPGVFCLGIDTGCCFGGDLAALILQPGCGGGRFPSDTAIVQVRAKKKYYHYTRVVAGIESKARSIQTEVAQAFIAAPKGDRKQFALWVRQHYKHLAPYLFAMLDGKDPEPLIYRTAFRRLQTHNEERK